MGTKRKWKPRKERNPIEVGTRFGRLEIVSESLPTTPECSYRYYPCRCDCGKETVIRRDSLLTGESTSCGCFSAQRLSARMTKHGLSKHRIADTYYSILKRCNNPQRKDFKHYGGRGIMVCERWSDPENGLLNFIEDMYPSYTEGYEIERIDNDGDYEPSNCKWATRREQVVNRRFEAGSIGIPRYITYQGETLYLAQWAERLGMKPSILVDRLGKLGWAVERALTTPVKQVGVQH